MRKTGDNYVDLGISDLCVMVKVIMIEKEAYRKEKGLKAKFKKNKSKSYT